MATFDVHLRVQIDEADGSERGPAVWDWQAIFDSHRLLRGHPNDGNPDNGPKVRITSVGAATRTRSNP